MVNYLFSCPSQETSHSLFVSSICSDFSRPEISTLQDAYLSCCFYCCTNLFPCFKKQLYNFLLYTVPLVLSASFRLVSANQNTSLCWAEVHMMVFSYFGKFHFFWGGEVLYISGRREHIQICIIIYFFNFTTIQFLHLGK